MAAPAGCWPGEATRYGMGAVVARKWPLPQAVGLGRQSQSAQIAAEWAPSETGSGRSRRLSVWEGTANPLNWQLNGHRRSLEVAAPAGWRPGEAKPIRSNCNWMGAVVAGKWPLPQAVGLGRQSQSAQRVHADKNSGGGGGADWH